MKFESAEQLRLAVRTYSIMKGKPVKPYTNEKKRFRAKCKPPCQWFIYASVERELGIADLVVKSMNNEHTNCSHVWKNKNISAKWLANKYMERFRCNVEMSPRLLRQIVDEDFKAEISKWVAYNARAIAKKEIQGNAEQQYKDIWRYCAEIKRTHPNTTMEVMFTPFRQPGCNPKFMRLYCCLGPLKQGFLDGCRPIIGVDGCHIKAEYRGQLLTAIGVDPNNGWWPIAWAVVEREATEQWKWFFELLKNDLQIENGYSYTFVSDQQKGLDRALSEVTWF
ncbi:uncharacterized protein [Coffea arabica]|uniref:MULE transposase domain-containing protein n=1 Tax=Coffea arabica TaxID=13443 RepID=A0ABM4VYY5_COFAR